MEENILAERKRRKLSRSQIILDICILLVVLLIWYVTETRKAGAEVTEGSIEVHIIDVGQADCALVRTENGNILIDAGSNDSEDDLCEYLDLFGVEKFEYCIFTHPHEDHIGGADRVLAEYEVENVIIPDVETNTSTYDRMMEAIEYSGATLIYAEAGGQYNLGELYIYIVAPVVIDSEHDLNNVSVMAVISFGDMDFMFTGDAESTEESDVLSEGFDIDCEFLKVGHHGSSTSTSKRFLEAVSPELAAISCGKENRYGHPHTETLERLDRYGVEYYRTDTDGTLVFVCDGKTILKSN